MIWGAVVVAAGRGTRFGRPKQLVELAGKPMVAWCIDAFAAMPEISELVVVTEPEMVERLEAIVHPRVRDAAVRVVRGGADRQASVRLGLEALSDEVTAVLVHDGARPLVRTPDVRAGMRLVRPGTASLLATPVVDTIKVADPAGRVTRTLDRATLWAAQTPQFATAKDLRRAHADALRILRAEGPPDHVVFHAFSGDAAMASECAASGFTLSYPGVVTFTNAPALREALRSTPVGALLVETDAPFLTPHPYRGRPNAPYLLPLTLRRVADELGADPDELGQRIRENGERVFGTKLCSS